MDEITIEDFQKIEIRIGTVTHAEVPEWSHWVIKLVVDFGKLGTRIIFTGMLGFHKPEEFINNQFPFILNLKKKKIGPAEDFSEGMLMATDSIAEPTKDNEGKPVLFKLQEEVENGAKVR